MEASEMPVGDGGVKLRLHKDGALPIVATFVQGPPAEACLTGEAVTGPFQRLQFRLKKNPAQDDRKRHHRELVGTNDTLTLEARNHGEGVVRDAGKYLLGVYNAKRRRVDLYPVEGGVIFGLNLTSVRGSGAAAGAAVSGGLDGLSMRERRDAVIADFASKKKQKMERSRKANIVDVGAVAAAGDVATSLRDTGRAASSKAAAGDTAPTAAGTASSGTSAAKVDDALMAARRLTLPHFDLSARAVELAYPLERLLAADVYRAVWGSAASFCRAVKEADAAAASDAVAAAAAADGAPEVAGPDAPPTVDDVIFRFARDSAFVGDRLRQLLPAARASSDDEEAGAFAAPDGEGEEGEGEQPDATGGDAVAEIDDGSENGEEAANRPGKKPRSTATPRRRGARAGAGILPLQKRLCCLLHLKHLLALHNAPRELRFRAMAPRPAAAPVSADPAAAAAQKGDAGEEAAAVRVAIPALRFIPDRVVSAMLETFTEARDDDRAASSQGLAAAATRAPVSEGVAAASARPRAAAAAADVPAAVYVREGALVDRLRAHMAVLALAADDYAGTDVLLLAADMKLVPSKLAATFREVGCTTKALKPAAPAPEAAVEAASAHGESSVGGTTGGQGSYFARLTVPLAFPKLKVGRR